ncbi:hypothetical protein [Nostoc sp.]
MYWFFVGLLLIVIGLTDSLLVFDQDLEHFLITQQYGHIFHKYGWCVE